MRVRQTRGRVQDDKGYGEHARTWPQVCILFSPAVSLRSTAGYPLASLPGCWVRAGKMISPGIVFRERPLLNVRCAGRIGGCVSAHLSSPRARTCPEARFVLLTISNVMHAVEVRFALP